MMISALLLALTVQDPSVEDLRAAARVNAVDLTDDELKLMVRRAGRNLRAFAALRRIEIGNEVVPAFELSRPIRSRRSVKSAPFELTKAERPDDLNELAFADINSLASLIKARKVSCVELTDLFLARLKRHDPTLHFVTHLCDVRARKRAKELDGLLDAGTWLGPLHGIPFGAKDLLSARGTPTTWGAEPYRDQVIDRDAQVIINLEAAGAVLIAKLTLGALAMGDVWYGGKTRSPWNPERGSSGSSAGPASATAAGCVPFAIGSETLGSIVSPSIVCACTSLRPSLGLIETGGAMTLSWSMDKLGPICRSVDDLTYVLPAMIGEKRASGLGYPYPVVGEVPLKGLRIGVLKERRRRVPEDVVTRLREMGASIVPLELPKYPTRDMTFILSCEAAAAFDELTRSGADDKLVRQGEGAWPNIFRVHRMVPAVEYIQAQRVRTLLIRDTAKALEQVDVFVHSSHASLAHLNLTGQPTVIVPHGGKEGEAPRGFAFSGRLYGEVTVLSVARAWQRQSGHHLRHPDMKR